MALKRRDFLKTSAAFAAASAASGFSCIELASAAPIQAPVVDRVSVRVLVDGAYNLFLRPGEVKGVKIEPPPRTEDYRRAIHNEWGLSLFVESQRASEQHTVMLDFGYTPGALVNNMELIGADPKKIEALIAHPRARHLFQREGSRAGGDQLLRPRRHRQLGAAGNGSVGRQQGECARSSRRSPILPLF
jgi:hypothetical protein